MKKLFARTILGLSALILLCAYAYFLILKPCLNAHEKYGFEGVVIYLLLCVLFMCAGYCFYKVLEWAFENS